MRETPPLAHTDLLYRSHEEIQAIQNQRFRHQVALCFRAHPYYQEMFRGLKLTPEDFQTIEDVQKLPVTTKQDYLSNPEAFRLYALSASHHPPSLQCHGGWCLCDWSAHGHIRSQLPATSEPGRGRSDDRTTQRDSPLWYWKLRTPTPHAG